jgi:hypothetical protein
VRHPVKRALSKTDLLEELIEYKALYTLTTSFAITSIAAGNPQIGYLVSKTQKQTLILWNFSVD